MPHAAHLILLNLICPIIFWWWVQIMKLLTVQLPPFSCYFISLLLYISAKFLLRVLKHFSPLCSILRTVTLFVLITIQIPVFEGQHVCWDIKVDDVECNV
jgi:hypothetical protein